MNNDKTEALFGYISRMVGVSPNNHSRVGNSDISFKDHVKNLYIAATLYIMVKHWPHRSFSISLDHKNELYPPSRDDESHCSADVFFCSQSVDYCNILITDISWCVLLFCRWTTATFWSLTSADVFCCSVGGVLQHFDHWHQLMCSVVLSVDYCNILITDISWCVLLFCRWTTETPWSLTAVVICTGCRKFKTTQRK